MMPIGTRLDGSPVTLYAGSRYLRDRLGFEVDGSATTLRAAGDEARHAARQLAAAQGLIVAGTMILDPYSPDPVVHQQQRLAYAVALQQVSQARAMMVTARAVAQARQTAAHAPPMIRPGDVVSGPGGGAPVQRPAATDGDIPFAPEQREPAAAHELNHVVQQRNGPPTPTVTQ